MAKFDVSVFTYVSPEQIAKSFDYLKIFYAGVDGDVFYDLAEDAMLKVLGKEFMEEHYKHTFFSENAPDPIGRLSNHIRNGYFANRDSGFIDWLMGLDANMSRVFAYMVWDYGYNYLKEKKRGKYPQFGDE
ncbi:MAG: hypothetical protein QXL94_00145 [Candidatus Parvarchaeum sp.]